MTKANEQDDAAKEVMALMDANAQVQKRLAAMDETLAALNQRNAGALLQDTARAALERAGCRRSEIVLRGIKDDLKLGQDGSVVGVVSVDGVPHDVSLNGFVEQIAKGDWREFFAAPKTGSPSAGAGAGKDFDFSEEQFADTEFYLKNRDKIAEAYAKGRVRKRQK